MRRGLRATVLGCLAACATIVAARAEDAQLRQLAWIAGCWASEGGEPGSGEQWLPLAGGTMLGVSRTVREGRTATFEFMQIRADGAGRVLYVAWPGGKEGTSFALVKVGEGEAVFENPAHDFPQRVIYRLRSGNRLAARIEGMQDGKPAGVDFPMRRASCKE